MTTFIGLSLRIYGLYLVFMIIGVFVHALFANHERIERDKGIHPIVIGFSGVQIVALYILIFSNQGLAVLFPVALAAICLISVVKNRHKVMKLLSLLYRTISSDFLTVSLSVSIFCFHWRLPLGDYRVHIPVTANNDIVSWAQISQHIYSHGFSDPGRIVGLDAGYFARAFTPGVYPTIVFSSQLLRESIANSLLPILGISTVILAVSLRRLLRNLGISKFHSHVSAVFVQSTPIMFFVGYQFFLSQIQAVFLLVAIVSVVIDKRVKHSIGLEKLEFDFATALIVSAMILTYPQYVVLQYLLAILLLVDILNLKATVKSMLMITATFVFGSLLVAPNIHIAIERIVTLANDSTSGWPMPWVVPSQLLGFQWNIFRAPTEFEIDLSWILVLLYSYIYIQKRKEFQLTKLLNRIIVFVITTYTIVLLRNGHNSYVQFKWISSLSPILVASLLALLLMTSAKDSRSISKYGIGLTIPILLCSNLARTVWYDSQHASKTGVLQETVNLEKFDEIKNLKELNVKTGTYKESMWPAFFLSDTRVAVLDPSSYTVAEPLIAPTLINKEFNTFPWVIRNPVSDVYDLISYPKGKLSTTPTGLKADIFVHNPELLQVGVDTPVLFEIANIGSSTWLGSGQCLGCVNAAVRIVGEDGLEVIADWNRVSLKDFPNYVLPGQKVAGSTVLNISKPGRFILEITLVSEHVSWFNQIDTSSYRSIQIEVSK